MVAPSILLNADIALGTLGEWERGTVIRKDFEKRVLEKVHDCGCVGHTSLVCALM